MQIEEAKKIIVSAESFISLWRYSPHIFLEEQKKDYRIKEADEICEGLRSANVLLEKIKIAGLLAEHLTDSPVSVEPEVDVKTAEAIQETMKEIEYCHSDMLTKEERKHPRGSGWARVYDKLENIIKDSRFSD